jgi:beta-lactamase regulating signal transducer with metallopeptidase domain
MTEFFHLSHGYWDWLFRSSWQAAALIPLVLVAQWMFGNKLAPRWRYALWGLVLIRLALPVSPESAVSIFNFARIAPQPAVVQPAHSVASAEVRLAVHPSILEPAPIEESLPAALPLGTSQPAESRSPVVLHKVLSWQIVIPLLWLTGVALLLARIVIEQFRLTNGIRRAKPVNDPEVLTVLDHCRGLMRLRRSPRLFETDLVSSPALCGVWRPCLLLPPGLLSRFSDSELSHVFLHELAHVKRWDIAVNWLAVLLNVLHWFNPLVWLAFARMRADRELACDALALSCAQPDEARCYGRTILKLLEDIPLPSPIPGLVGILEGKARIERRIQMIARFPSRNRGRWLAVPLLSTLAACALTDAKQNEPESAAPAASLSQSTAPGPSADRIRIQDRLTEREAMELPEYEQRISERHKKQAEQPEPPNIANQGETRAASDEAAEMPQASSNPPAADGDVALIVETQSEPPREGLEPEHLPEARTETGQVPPNPTEVAEQLSRADSSADTRSAANSFAWHHHAALQKEWMRARQLHSLQLKAAATEEERLKLKASNPDQFFAARFLELAEKLKGDPTAVRALIDALHCDRNGIIGERAMELLLRNHVHRPELLILLGARPAPKGEAAENFFRGIAGKSASRTIQAHALIALGGLIKERQHDEAEKLFRRVLDEYSNLKPSRMEKFYLRDNPSESLREKAQRGLE